jgi:putative transposase
VYPVIFIDCVNVKIRDGNVANRPIYVALVVTVDGHRDILGLWAGEHGDGEGAKYWMRVLAEIKNRGTCDCLIVVCDGLKGLPEAIAAIWPQTIVQTCIVHLLRNSFKYPRRKTGQQSPATSNPSTPHPRNPPRWMPSPSSAKVGKEVSRDHPPLDQRLGRVRALPLIRPGNPHDHLHHQRNRVDQRPDPASGQRPRALPHRGGRPEMRLPRDHEPGPHRQGTATLVQPLESRPQRLRDHLRRTPVHRTEVTPHKIQLHR